MPDSFPLFLCRKHVLPGTLQAHPWAPRASGNTRRFLSTRAGLCPRTGLFLVPHLAKQENQPKRQQIAAWSSLKASYERTIINKTLSVSQPRRLQTAAWSSLKASNERIIFNKSSWCNCDWPGPYGTFPGQMSPTDPHHIRLLPLICRKTSKNKLNQRSGKMQKQRKTVKNDNNTVLVKQSQGP